MLMFSTGKHVKFSYKIEESLKAECLVRHFDDPDSTVCLDTSEPQAGLMSLTCPKYI